MFQWVVFGTMAELMRLFCGVTSDVAGDIFS
jgi:hypothetical protein